LAPEPLKDRSIESMLTIEREGVVFTDDAAEEGVRTAVAREIRGGGVGERLRSPTAAFRSSERRS